MKVFYRALSGVAAAEGAFDDGGEDVLEGVAGRLLAIDAAVGGEFVDDDGQELGEQGHDFGGVDPEFGGEALEGVGTDGGLDLAGFDGLVFAGADPGFGDVTEAGLVEFFHEAGHAADLTEQAGDGVRGLALVGENVHEGAEVEAAGGV